MILALTSAELGVNSFTINLILLTAIVVLLALPTFFLFKSSQGKSAVSKKTEVELCKNKVIGSFWTNHCGASEGWFVV